MGADRGRGKLALPTWGSDIRRKCRHHRIHHEILCYLLRISGIYPLPSLQAAASPVQAPSPHRRHRSASIPFHPPLSSSPGSSQRNLRNLFKVDLITASAFSQPQIPRPDSVFIVLRYFVQGLEHGGGAILGPIPMDAEGRLDVSCSQAPLFLIALNSL